MTVHLLRRCMRSLALALVLGPSLPAADPAPVPPAPPKLSPVPVRNVQVRDRFWTPRLKVIRERTLPHSWQYVEGEIRALRRAAGQNVPGEPNGTWGEANLFKVLETAAYSLALAPDAALEARLDDIIRTLAAAQRADGYVHAHVQNAGKAPWDPAFLDGSHDGYVLGHLIEAALEHHAATGKTAFLDVARKAADQACRHFLGPNGSPGFCGHAELEMALVELYRVAPERRYLDLARALVEWRGRGKVRPFSGTPRAYFQDAVPLREQHTLEGHAVRAVFFATGVADLARETSVCDYRLAAQRFWASTAGRRMTVTGSIGPRQEHEALGEDYELPLNGYYESCAACGLADFAHRMALLEGDAACIDVLERVLYNAVGHGLALDGCSSYYQNPVSDRDHVRDNCWVCCPPNLSRTLLQVGRYAYAYGPREVVVAIPVGGTATFPLTAGPVRLDVETDYPWSGEVKFRVGTDKAASFALRVRVPGWCEERPTVKVNGQAVAGLARDDRGWLVLDREWQPGDTVELSLPMPVRRVLAHPNVRDCQGKAALVRGPLVYGFEGVDNGGNPHVELAPETAVVSEFRADLLGGVVVLRGTAADGRGFTAVPFYALANREKSSQEVWQVQRGWKPNAAWWQGRLYRPLTKDDLAGPDAPPRKPGQ